MSLLLEALKKAEKAKEEAQRKARAESGAAPLELRLEGDPVPSAEGKHVVTRDELPDISQPLEILTDDLPPKPAGAAAVPPSAVHPSAAPAQAPKAGARAEPRTADTGAAARATAKKVFEAKFREPNPRLPFYITLGVLGVFVVGTVIYFWYQLRPPPPLVNLNPGPRPAAEAVAEAPASAPARAAAAPSAAPSIPGLPAPAAAAAAPAAPLVRAPATAAAATPPQSMAQAAPAAPRRPAAEPAARAPERPRLSPQPQLTPPTTPSEPASRTPQVHPRVEAGYAAYQAGDLAVARTEYQAALRDEAGNRDALLGLAAVEVRTGRHEAAEAIYLRLLQADPRDPHAQAALLSLRGGRGDATVAESRVKTLLAADPSAHMLNFTLGNQLAQQGRWAEAQQEYFKAFAGEPGNADFAYNLAVSLDQLRQPRLALEYYQRALGLAAKHGASFDPESARARVAQLAR